MVLHCPPTCVGVPPTLYNQHIDPISNYSKASRGLSVLLRVTGIFTGIVISPSFSQRQFSDRYAIRAGRNLHDKEFRLTLLRLLFELVENFTSRFASLTRRISMRCFHSHSLCRHRVQTISFLRFALRLTQDLTFGR